MSFVSQAKKKKVLLQKKKTFMVPSKNATNQKAYVHVPYIKKSALSLSPQKYSLLRADK